MIDLTSLVHPSVLDFYKDTGHIFEIECFNPEMVVIWSIFSPIPDVLELNKPWSLYKKIFSIRSIIMRKEFKK